MDLVAVGIAAFLVGGAVAGAFAWLLATARVRTVMEAALRESGQPAGGRGGPGRRAGARSCIEERALMDGAKAQLADTFAALARRRRCAPARKISWRSPTSGWAPCATQTAMDVGGARSRRRSSRRSRGWSGRCARRWRRSTSRSARWSASAARPTASCAQQLKAVTETQVKLHDATGSLVSALKAPAVRGRWGEMQLRRVVELAGMLEHCDFDEQTTLAGVDGRLRPDMIIHLPGGRRIVVDAKAPLGAYLEAREAPDDETRAAKYRQHAGAGARAHDRSWARRATGTRWTPRPTWS